jgi:predicted CoA-binding protein
LSEGSSNAVQFDQVTDAVVVQKRVAMVGIRNRSRNPEFAVVKFLR